MGLEFLARVRRTTLWASGVAALLGATYGSPAVGLALACGAAWSLANLALIQQLVVALTTLRDGSPRSVLRGGLAALAMLPLFGAGAVLLVKLPIAALLAGFAIPFAVLVLKAVALVLLPTPLWLRITRDPRLAAPLVLAAFAALWLGASALPGVDTAMARARHHAIATHRAVTTRHAPAAAAPAAAAVPKPAAATPAPEPSGEHKSEGAPEFPTLVTLLEAAFPNAPWMKAVLWFEPLLFSLLIAVLLIWLVRAATRNPQLVPGPLQNLVEYAVEGLNDFITGILGPRDAPRFVPLLGTLFLYILFMNLFGLIPLMKSPTASLNVTVALALTVFVYVQWIGLRGLGPIGYVHHLMGSPSDFTGWLLVPIMLPIHILGELAKPISLSCRLFGNVFGEDMLLVGFATLGITILKFSHLPFGLPLHALFFPLALLSSALQAMVFTVLSTIYILLMLPHDHGHGTEDAVLEHSPI